MSAADNIMNKRKRQSKAVQDGYNSNKIFEHTIADIIKVLEKELESQGISTNLARQNVKNFRNANDSQQLHTFKSLESLSEGDD